MISRVGPREISRGADAISLSQGNQRPARFPAVANEIQTHLNVSRVYLTEYPDLTLGPDGIRDNTLGDGVPSLIPDILELIPRIGDFLADLLGNEFKIDTEEAEFARDQAFPPPRGALIAATLAHGWSFLKGLSSAFTAVVVDPADLTEDVIDGGAGVDGVRILGTPGRDVIRVGRVPADSAAFITVSVNGRGRTIRYLEGETVTIFGGAGRDVFSAGSDRDRFVGGPGLDVVYPRGGSSLVQSNSTSAALRAGQVHQTLALKIGARSSIMTLVGRSSRRRGR